MTIAICIKCGAEKFGAFVSCKACGFRPTSDEELAKSLMVTDRYFPVDTLRNIGKDLSAGGDVQFSPENIAALVDTIHKDGLRRMIGLEAAKPRKKPWWKLF